MNPRPFVLALAAAAALVAAAPAHAANVSKTVPFALDQWWDLSSSAGPVTLHRIKIAEVKAGFDKSALFRPGNSERLQTVQIRIEYSNTASNDKDARVKVLWKDAAGEVIDGYEDTESLDDGSSHDVDTITLSTLKYGLSKAKTVEISIDYDND